MAINLHFIGQELDSWLAVDQKLCDAYLVAFSWLILIDCDFCANKFSDGFPQKMVNYWKDLDTIRARYEIIHPRAILKWWNPGLRGPLYNLSSNAHFKDKLKFSLVMKK